ncbi:putative Ileal sodium/bile acid cotransporter [Cucumis melo var. makuwa]|nr:putative Ileal sodium/bile acid cotransporter [Cucumis melo var. makuwa]TYJ98160.1 putative Ileal sodium/bile acid cotransporter [Cucumis melo var. makuwa]
MNELYSFITAINERNPEINSLPICITMQRPSPANSSKTENNVGKTILGLTFQAVLALFITSPNSSPPLLTHLFAAAVLISFAVSFAGIFLQNGFPRIALLFEKIGALIAAIGVCIVASLLIHQNFAWISWLASGFSLMAFVLSFRG